MSAIKPSTAMSVGLLLLRLGTAGLLFYGHGWGKITHYGERAGRFSDPIGLGPAASFALVVFAEVVCSTLVALGLLTRLAVVPLLIFFAVAGFIQHADDPWNRRELAFLFGVAFLTLLFTGPGRYSLDAVLFRRRSPGVNEGASSSSSPRATPGPV